MEKKSFFKKTLSGIKDTASSVSKRIEENQRYKQSPEYRKKVLDELKYKQQVAQQKKSLLQTETDLDRLRSSSQTSIFGSGGMGFNPITGETTTPTKAPTKKKAKRKTRRTKRKSPARRVVYIYR